MQCILNVLVNLDAGNMELFIWLKRRKQENILL